MKIIASVIQTMAPANAATHAAATRGPNFNRYASVAGPPVSAPMAPTYNRTVVSLAAK